MLPDRIEWRQLRCQAFGQCRPFTGAHAIGQTCMMASDTVGQDLADRAKTMQGDLSALG